MQATSTIPAYANGSARRGPSAGPRVDHTAFTNARLADQRLQAPPVSISQPGAVGPVSGFVLRGAGLLLRKPAEIVGMFHAAERRVVAGQPDAAIFPDLS